jgi:hypothetical protein
MADHAWCQAVASDERVRAAEDNRTLPLPTLGEAIAAPFACTACGGFGMDHRCKESCEQCDGSGRAMFPKRVSASSAPDHENKGVRMTKSDRQAAEYRAEAQAAPFAEAAERSVPVSKTGEGQSRMRTERVTLEVKHFSTLHADQWGWGVFAQPVLRPGESVRVVEDEKSSDADAEVLRHAFVASEIKRLKAESEVERLRKELEAASGNPPETPEGSTQAASGGGEHPRWWLTEEEREMLNAAKTYIPGGFRAKGIIDNLLARSSPPEVVLPEPPFHPNNIAYGDWMMCLNAVEDALAAAGVAVKEVG